MLCANEYDKVTKHLINFSFFSPQESSKQPSQVSSRSSFLFPQNMEALSGFYARCPRGQQHYIEYGVDESFFAVKERVARSVGVAVSSVELRVDDVLLGDEDSEDLATADSGVVPFCVVDVACGRAKAREALEDLGVILSPRSLAESAQRGRLQVLKLLVASGIEPTKATSALGATPLFSAIASGQIQTADYLLTLRGSADESTALGETPLMEACKVASYNAVQLLLKHGADPTKCDAYFVTPFGHLIQSIKGTVASILDPSERNQRHKNAAAFFAETLSIAEELSRREDFLDVISESALKRRKVLGGDAEPRPGALLMLSEISATLKQRSSHQTQIRRHIGSRPPPRMMPGSPSKNLGAAAQRSATVFLKSFQAVLRDKARTMLSGANKRSLHAAVCIGSRKDVLLNVLCGVDVNTVSSLGETPLCIAVRRRDLMMTEMLVNVLGADPSLPDVEGISPLMHAAQTGCTWLVNFLLLQTPSLKHCDRHGANLHDHAMAGGSENIVAIVNKACGKSGRWCPTEEGFEEVTGESF